MTLLGVPYHWSTSRLHMEQKHTVCHLTVLQADKIPTPLKTWSLCYQISNTKRVFVFTIKLPYKKKYISSNGTLIKCIANIVKENIVPVCGFNLQSYDLKCRN